MPHSTLQRGLYLITPDDPDPARLVARTRPLLSLASCLQLRNKVMDAQALGQAGVMLRDACRAARVPFIVNDAPALAAADVGVAMGAGSDVAIESAGVTLLGGDLQGIVRARHLSRAVMGNIRQNLVFAFGYNALGIPVAAGLLYPVFGWLLSPALAALAMALSSVSVIGNALRLRAVRL